MYFPTREDAAYSTYPRFYYTHNHPYSAYEQAADFSAPQYYGMRSSPMQMMASQFAPVPLRSDPPTSSTSEDLSSAAQKKKTSRWTETEEKILIELFGENEEKLRYKAYNSPEWESIAKQLHERCRREHVSSDKTAQQCKNKMSNLTKKYKTTKDKLRTTGYGKGRDVESDKEAEGELELVPKHYQDMDEILGNREAINPRHVLESSSLIEAQSSPQIDQDIRYKEILDEEVSAAVSAQKRKLVQSDDLPGPSGEVGTSDSEEDESLAFAKSLFFKNKGKQGKCTSTPKSTPKNTPKSRKDGKKAVRKKTKATTVADEPTVLSFMERAQKRDEAFMERMAEAERESRREQQKFSMDALKMLGNILKDVANGKE